MRRLASGMTLVLPAVLAACTSLAPAGTPHDATAVFRPASMVADRETAAPGDIVELRFPDRMTRGILFVLDEEVGETWVHRFNLTSDGPGPEWQVEWFAADDESVAFPDIGVGGVGPDRVVIPDVATAGSWRLCTGNALENVCVRIQITPP